MIFLLHSAFFFFHSSCSLSYIFFRLYVCAIKSSLAPTTQTFGNSDYMCAYFHKKMFNLWFSYSRQEIRQKLLSIATGRFARAYVHQFYRGYNLYNRNYNIFAYTQLIFTYYYFEIVRLIGIRVFIIINTYVSPFNFVLISSLFHRTAVFNSFLSRLMNRLMNRKDLPSEILIHSALKHIINSKILTGHWISRCVSLFLTFTETIGLN